MNPAQLITQLTEANDVLAQLGGVDVIDVTASLGLTTYCVSPEDFQRLFAGKPALVSHGKMYRAISCRVGVDASVMPWASYCAGDFIVPGTMKELREELSQ